MHHLVSRGVQLAVQQAGREDFEDIKLKLPATTITVIALATMFHVIFYFANNYTYGILVPILTSVESPVATAIVRTTETYTDEDTPDAPLLTKEEKESQAPVIDEEVLIVGHKPITSTWIGLTRHLKEKTGSNYGGMRAVGGFVIYQIVLTLATAVFPLYFINAGLLCVLSTAWIQQMVAMPGMSYFQRVKQLSQAGGFKKLVVPVMFVEAIETAVSILPGQSLKLLSEFARGLDMDDHCKQRIVLAGGLLFGLFAIINFVCVVIPLKVGLVRFQASLLDAETETIVPIDRTLGGVEDPPTLKGIQGVKAGWKSFSRDGLRRLAKNYAKYIMLQSFMMLMFIITVGSTLYAAIGDEGIKKIRSKMGHHAHI